MATKNPQLTISEAEKLSGARQTKSSSKTNKQDQQNQVVKQTNKKVATKAYLKRFL